MSRHLYSIWEGGSRCTSFRNSPNQPPDPETVRNVCLVIDVLGGDFRNHIIERYLQIQLAEYRRIFRSTEEASLARMNGETFKLTLM